MRIPLIIRIGALVLATTGFYTYVGQMVPQKEVQPPKETALTGEMTTADMVKVGQEIMQGKGICLTCHTIGKTGALRFPDLAGIGDRAKHRVAGMSDVEYLAQSLYEPTAFVVPGFPPAMPPMHEPPIALTDQEILCVIAALQSLGGTPTVTLKTTHHYYNGTAAPGGTPAPAAAPGPAPGEAPAAVPPTTGAQLNPPFTSVDSAVGGRHFSGAGSGGTATFAKATVGPPKLQRRREVPPSGRMRVATYVNIGVRPDSIPEPVVAHQTARLFGAARRAAALQGRGGTAR